jgi:hypothetical protein
VSVSLEADVSTLSFIGTSSGTILEGNRHSRINIDVNWLEEGPRRRPQRKKQHGHIAPAFLLPPIVDKIA